MAEDKGALLGSKAFVFNNNTNENGFHITFTTRPSIGMCSACCKKFA